MTKLLVDNKAGITVIGGINASGDVLPLIAIDNGDGTATLKMLSKGSPAVAHESITDTATSNEIDCQGFNSLLIFWESDKVDKTWTIQILGSTVSGGTFVEWITSSGAANLYTTDISGFFVINGIPNFIKVVATEVDDGATVSCTVQPINM